MIKLPPVNKSSSPVATGWVLDRNKWYLKSLCIAVNARKKSDIPEVAFLREATPQVLTVPLQEPCPSM